MGRSLAFLVALCVFSGLLVTVSPVASEAVSVQLVWQRTFPGVAFRESSPTPATLATQAVVVGGEDGHVYAFDAATGANEPGWPVTTSNGVDSSPSAADVTGDGKSQIFVGSGFAGAGPACSGGGAYAFEPTGAVRWHNVLSDPGCASDPIQSSFAIGDNTGDGQPDATAGALGLVAPSYNAASGVMNPGWPYYTDDTVFSTPALADIDGDSIPEVIMGGDSSPGGTINFRGGMVRALGAGGNLLWEFNIDEQVRSSPAVGDITGAGQPSVVFGAGNYWETHGGANDSHSVFALDLSGNLRWRRDLGGDTLAGPALADVAGTGHADVIEGTAGAGGGAVWVLDGNGNPLPGWGGKPSGGGVVIGGISTADVNHDGAQDLLVPTGAGVFIYDGRTAGLLAVLDQGLVSFQNTPLATDDGGGNLGVTVAGTEPNGTGIVQHFRIQGGTLGSTGWPMFHHDARHTGNLVPPSMATHNVLCDAPGGYWFVARDGGIFSFCSAGFFGSAGGQALPAPIVGMASTPSGRGYWLVASNGSVYNFGDAPPLGGATHLSQPIVGMAPTPSGNGYWLVAADGGIFNFGDAAFHGSTGAIRLTRPIVGMAPTPSGNGYWLVAADGGIFNFGDAAFHGSTGAIRLVQPIVGMARSPSGNGYWLVASDGGIFNFGGAAFHGSTGNLRLSQPIVGMAPTPSGNGYWLVAADGGIFNFGDAGFHGSTGAIRLAQPIVGMARSPSGNGYWLVASDGGIFNFGGAAFHGSTGNLRLSQPIVGMAPTPSGNGYWLVASDGGIFAFGDAAFHGSTGYLHLSQPIAGMAVP